MKLLIAFAAWCTAVLGWKGISGASISTKDNPTSPEWAMWRYNPTVSLISKEQSVGQQTPCLLSGTQRPDWNSTAVTNFNTKKASGSCLQDHHALLSPVHGINLSIQLQHINTPKFTRKVPCTAGQATEICSCLASHLYYHQQLSKTVGGFLHWKCQHKNIFLLMVLTNT